jgi:hypothetical protein
MIYVKVTRGPISEPPKSTPQLSKIKELSKLKDVKDFTDFDEQELGYRFLIEYLDGATKSGNTIWLTNVDRDCICNPERYRGSWVKVRGLVINFSPVKVSKTREIHRYYLTPDQGQTAFVCDIIHPTPPTIRSVRQHTGAKADVADVEGIFYKVVQYEARTGAIKQIPYIIASQISRVDPNKVRHRYRGPSTIIGVAILSLIFAVFLILRPLWRRSK